MKIDLPEHQTGPWMRTPWWMVWRPRQRRKHWRWIVDDKGCECVWYWQYIPVTTEANPIEDMFDDGERALASIRAGKCGCWKCVKERGERPMHMIVCPTCGNKRCPKANNHNNACTNSNESGQPGSAYE